MLIIGKVILEKLDNRQSNFANELKNFDNGIKALEKKYFLNNVGLLFSAREKVLNSFKHRLFPTKYLDNIPTPEPATEPETATEPEVATKKQKHKLNAKDLH